MADKSKKWSCLNVFHADTFLYIGRYCFIRFVRDEDEVRNIVENIVTCYETLLNSLLIETVIMKFYVIAGSRKFGRIFIYFYPVQICIYLLHNYKNFTLLQNISYNNNLVSS